MCGCSASGSPRQNCDPRLMSGIAPRSTIDVDTSGRKRCNSNEAIMGSTYLSLHYHIVFSTKERRPLIGADWRPRLHEYVGGTVRGLGGVAETIGGVENHVHLLVGLKATHC